MVEMINLGRNHILKWMGWHPDRELNPQYKDIEDNNKIGALIEHLTTTKQRCAGTIYFDCDVTRKIFPDKPTWKVESWNPLTITPSVLCRSCGDHGHIINGKWTRC